MGSEVVEHSLNDAVLQDLYSWVDQIPLSRPKKNFARDFSDGVLMSEIVKHYYPRMVDIHNYISTNATQTKFCNWETLNKKVFRKLAFSIKQEDVKSIVDAKRGAIEKVMLHVRKKLGEYESKRQQRLSHKSSTESAKKLVDQEGYHASRDSYSTTYQESPNRKTSVPKQSHDDASNKHELPGSDAEIVVTAMDNHSDHLNYPELLRATQALAHSRQTAEILQEKVDQLEQLLALKDGKIEALEEQLRDMYEDSPKLQATHRLAKNHFR